MVKQQHLAGHAGTSSSCALMSDREPWSQSLKRTCRIVDVPDDLSWALFAYSGAASAAGQVYTGAVLCTPDGRWPVPAAEHRINAALRLALLLSSQLTHNAALAELRNVTRCQQAGMSVSIYDPIRFTCSRWLSQASHLLQQQASQHPSWQHVPAPPFGSVMVLQVGRH